MEHFSVRRRAYAFAIAGAAVALMACQDKRVRQLDTGISRDSALTVIGQNRNPASGADSLPNVYKRERYLINGKNYEVLYFTANDAKQGKDSVPLKKLTPIAFINNKMVGKGWDYLDSLYKANNIPVAKR